MSVEVDPGKCDRCGTCISVCQSNAIVLLSDGLVIDNHVCCDCETCVAICPFGALSKAEHAP